MSGRTRTCGDALTVKRSALCKNDRLEPANNTRRARISAAAEQRRVNREENLMFAVQDVRRYCAEWVVMPLQDNRTWLADNVVPRSAASRDAF